MAPTMSSPLLRPTSATHTHTWYFYIYIHVTRRRVACDS
jgi:hypothetical protein